MLQTTVVYAVKVASVYSALDTGVGLTCLGVGTYSNHPAVASCRPSSIVKFSSDSLYSPRFPFPLSKPPQSHHPRLSVPLELASSLPSSNNERGGANESVRVAL